ncbi:hypothetical protein [Clavibacter michiganensis]|uniref:Uncharacterized protein n=1 Tax=Clavibacter michiganensis TaxID=28447 RepID=A0A251YNQ4_9MICO|nr:hypothetical protein [Clavibacter michiganensis]OUE25871.1 hypothetical protein BFL37_05690 [Clavibacter michiganensis]
MQIIHYGESTYVTGDDIAHAVLEYAKALAHAESSDVVAIPFRRDDDADGRLELLIGPASQIVLERADEAIEEIRDAVLVADITRRTRLLAHDAAEPIDIDEQRDAVLPIPDDL